MPVGKKMRSAGGAIPFWPKSHPAPLKAVAKAATATKVFTAEALEPRPAERGEVGSRSEPGEGRLYLARNISPQLAAGILWLNVPVLYFLRTAWAAARRAIGKRYGEQDT